MSPSLTRLRIPATILVAAALAFLVAALLPAPAEAAGREGWGRYPSFIGRYHVKVVDGGRMHVVGGELTMFPQEEFPGSVQPAGILKLRMRNGRNDLVYLTDLSHRGRARLATIKGGGFLGPKIGSFRGRFRARGRISATLTTRALGAVQARFVRFSRSPTP